MGHLDKEEQELLDRFACAALPAIITKDWLPAEKVADAAYYYAQAMLEERERRMTANFKVSK